MTLNKIEEQTFAAEVSSFIPKEKEEVMQIVTSTAGRKSKVKSQKSKRIQYRLLGDLSWLVYLRRSVLVGWNKELKEELKEKKI